MTSLKKIAFATALVILPCSVFADNADYFVRPEIDYVSPQDKGTSEATVGYGLSFGKQLGSDKEHEISLDLLYWDENKTLVETLPVTSTIRSKHKMMPLLLDYRYYAGSSDGRLRLFLGALAGYTNADESFNVNQTSAPVFSGTASATRWLPTLGGTAGIEIKTSDRVSVQLGYRYLHIFEKNYGGATFTFHPVAYNADIFTGAVSIKF
jgi:hypothetical protein